MNTPVGRGVYLMMRFLTVFTATLFGPCLSRAFDWEVSTIQPGKWFEDVSPRSLVLDGNGLPQIAYGGRDLYNAWYDGSEWQITVVDTGPGMGAHASIALAPGSSSTCIGYFDASAGQVKCAKWVSLGSFPVFWHWRIETVATADTGRSITVAVNTAEQPSLLFFSPSGDVLYAYRDTNLWHIETVYSNAAGDTQNYADMMIDSAGRTQVVFSRNNKPLTHAQRELNGVWTRTSFGSAEGGDSYPALALDAADRPHVVYARNDPFMTPSYLIYTHFDGVTWQEEAIDSSETPWVAYDISAAMRAGKLHVSYFDPYDNILLYRNVTDGTSATVAAGTNAGWSSSIAVNASGEPQIGNYDGALEQLIYASPSGASWSVEIVDQARSAPQYCSVATDPSGVVHATWVDVRQQHLTYAQQIETGWDVTVLDDGVMGSTSLKLASNGDPAVAYYSGASNALRFAAFVKTGLLGKWNVETVDTGGGQSCSLALDGDNMPWISYVAGGNLKCAYKDAKGWHLFTLDNAGTISDLGTSLALGPSGAPSIAYASGDPGVLMCAICSWHLGVLLWHSESVETSQWLVAQPTLAFNGDGQPCIASVDADRGALFAWRDGAGWHVQDVDTSPQDPGSASYAMDESGRHYLVYISEDRFLRHAFGYGIPTNLTWRVQTIEASQLSLNQGLALAVRDSVPHLVFSGPSSGREVLCARGLPLRLTRLSRVGGVSGLLWSGETYGVDVESCTDLKTQRWSAIATNLSGTAYWLYTTNPAVFYRLRLE